VVLLAARVPKKDGASGSMYVLVGSSCLPSTVLSDEHRVQTEARWPTNYRL